MSEGNRKAVLIWLLIGIFLIATEISVVLLVKRFPLPEAVSVKADHLIPSEFDDLRDRETVRPGTFRLDVSLDEIFQEARRDKYLLVVYNAGSADSSARNYLRSPSLEYWLEHEAGTWKYHKEQMPVVQEKWFPDSLILKWKGYFDPETKSFTYIPEHDVYSAAILFTVAAALSVVSLGLAVMILGLFVESFLSRRQRRQFC